MAVTLQSEIGLARRDSAAVKTAFQAVQALVDRLDGRLQRLVLGEPQEDAPIMDVATMRREIGATATDLSSVLDGLDVANRTVEAGKIEDLRAVLEAVRALVARADARLHDLHQTMHGEPRREDVRGARTIAVWLAMNEDANYEVATEEKEAATRLIEGQGGRQITTAKFSILMMPPTPNVLDLDVPDAAGNPVEIRTSDE